MKIIFTTDNAAVASSLSKKHKDAIIWLANVDINFAMFAGETGHKIIFALVVTASVVTALMLYALF